ncbi:MAG: flagellar biosynthetic protein FliR [Deltaproteobacteria bacterium]|nr:flagellar biosynthetic protein FliR [Candidatus Anaeroferrophillus wilburensis]MBN2889589.1 flagellar biosynthetic protein FliR [Deltaproteobacteria bacterium]
MITIPAFSIAEVELFVLIVFRVAGMIFMVPIFNDQAIPALLKTGISLLLAIVLFPFLRQTSFTPLFAGGLVMVLLQIIRELAIGVTVGFLAAMLLAAVQTAGQLMGFQMGFSIVNVIDPVSSVQVSIIAQFQYLIALLVFLSLGAHRWFIKAMNDSFQLIPLGGFTLSDELLAMLMTYAANIFIVAIKLGAPLMVALLLCNVILGVLARTVPQMNIFIVGYPLQIGLGLLVLAFSTPYMLAMFRGLYVNLFNDIFLVLQASGSG